MEKVWVIKDPDQYLNSRKTQLATQALSLPEEKDPALAYTLSLLFWGAGQLYNGQRVKGLSFICLFMYGNAVALLTFTFQHELPFYLGFYGVSPAQAILAAAFLLLFCLFFWIFNASDAYYAAAKTRHTPFTGVSNPAYPALCSLLLPGWGQFLNGQPIKGSLIAGCAVLGFFSLIFFQNALQVWPSLENSASRIVVEVVLVLSLFTLPLMPVLWIFGVFDAWKVSRDDIKKESIIERLKATNNRRRTHGWVRGVFPQIKRTLILLAVLAVLVLVISHFYFPRHFYQSYLTKALMWSSEQGMVLVPELIKKIIAALPATCM
jgi:TM2 domain-containing membrane protein YozV